MRSMKWALVLSGGGAKGLPYIGMFKVFEELNIPKPSLVVGCSIGAVIGSMYALGKTSDEMEQYFTGDFNPNDYLGAGNLFNLKLVNKVLQTGTALNNLLSGNSLDDGQKIYTFLRRLTDGKTFAQTKIPFVCNAFDLHSGMEVILKEGELAKSVLASSSYPLLLAPVRIKDKLLVDGGIAHNTPVSIAAELGFRNIVSVTLDSFSKTSFPHTYSDAASLLVRVFSCIGNTKSLRKNDYPSFWINLSNKIDSMDFSEALSKITVGYKLTLEQKENIKMYFTSGMSGSLFRKNIKENIKKTYTI